VGDMRMQVPYDNMRAGYRWGDGRMEIWAELNTAELIGSSLSPISKMSPAGRRIATAFLWQNDQIRHLRFS
jgi:hypothetical protein